MAEILRELNTTFDQNKLVLYNINNDRYKLLSAELDKRITMLKSEGKSFDVETAIVLQFPVPSPDNYLKLHLYLHLLLSFHCFNFAINPFIFISYKEEERRRAGKQSMYDTLIPYLFLCLNSS